MTSHLGGLKEASCLARERPPRPGWPYPSGPAPREVAGRSKTTHGRFASSISQRSCRETHMGLDSGLSEAEAVCVLIIVVGAVEEPSGGPAGGGRGTALMPRPHPATPARGQGCASQVLCLTARPQPTIVRLQTRWPSTARIPRPGAGPLGGIAYLFKASALRVTG